MPRVSWRTERRSASCHPWGSVGDDVEGYRYLEHTADVGIEAWGPDLRTAFTEAATGLCALMVDPATVEERVRRRIAVDADDAPDLLVRFLSELIALVDSDGIVFNRVEIVTLSERHLEASAWGEPIDPHRHRLRTAVKAATYHALSVRPGPPARARVILDL